MSKGTNTVEELAASSGSSSKSFFLGVVLALMPGVAVALASIYLFREAAAEIAQVAILLLLFVLILTSVFFLFRHRLLDWIGIRIRASAGTIGRLVVMTFDPTTDRQERREAATELAQQVFSWQASASSRRWLVYIVFGLFGTFVGAVGTTLLSAQNELITKQNEYFQQQNHRLGEQIKQERDNNISVRRATLISRLYDRTDCDTAAAMPCPHVSNIRSRVEAAKAFVDLERSLYGDPPPCMRPSGNPGITLLSAIEQIRMGPARDSEEYREHYLKALGETRSQAYISLDGVDLSGGRFSRSSWSYVSLSHSNLSDANLISADLKCSDLYGVNLRSAQLVTAGLRGTDLREADLSYADLTGAEGTTQTNLTGANLTWAKLRSVKFHEVDLIGSSICGADLRGADLRNTGVLVNSLSQACLDEYTQLTLDNNEFLPDPLCPPEVDEAWKRRFLGTMHESEETLRLCPPSTTGQATPS